ncbi:putative rmlC-like cupin domain superfamily, rmlC-like jelly roll protein [Helianthus annuus]|nr:putative rmlC-like cupin domain superfamily, rmlC-like jelly roll protein [Helianthus annuus]
MGVVSWWFNGGDSDAVILLLGDSSKSLVPGQFTNFFGVGPLGLLAGFQSDFVGKNFGLDQKESENIVNSQQARCPCLFNLIKESNFQHQVVTPRVSYMPTLKIHQVRRLS